MATDLYEISGLCVDVEYMIMGVLANNVYIVSDGEGTMVVDPSCSADKILAALGERKLDAIVLTHSHFDHTGAAAELREATGAPVIASAILVGTLWFTLLSPRGVVNSIIHAFGLPSVNWLGGKLTSMLSVCIVSVWKNVGYFLVIYFAPFPAGKTEQRKKQRREQE